MVEPYDRTVGWLRAAYGTIRQADVTILASTIPLEIRGFSGCAYCHEYSCRRLAEPSIFHKRGKQHQIAKQGLENGLGLCLPLRVLAWIYSSVDRVKVG